MYLRQDSGSVNRTSPVPGLNVVTSCHSFRSSRMAVSDSKGFGVGLTASSWSTSCSSLDLSTNRAMRCSPSPPSPSSARSSSRSVDRLGTGDACGCDARWVDGCATTGLGCIAAGHRAREGPRGDDRGRRHRDTPMGDVRERCVRVCLALDVRSIRKASFRLTIYRPLVTYVNQLRHSICLFQLYLYAHLPFAIHQSREKVLLHF